jgi:hypothetical protein
MQLISQIYSWNETLHVLDSSFVHHQEYSEKLLMMNRGTVRNM